MKTLARTLLLTFIFTLFTLTAVPSLNAQGPAVVINEVLVGNASTNLDPQFTNYGGWVELYNPGPKEVDLSNYYLTNNLNKPKKSKIPKKTKIPAGGYLLLWVDENVKGVHMNFDLDMDGDDVALFTPQGVLVDSISFDEQEPDISLGRSPDGGSNWLYFDQPTPGAANTTPGYATLDIADKPDFSLSGGFYNGNRTLVLTTGEPGGTIHYTLDGSKPTAASPIYTNPIQLNETTVVRARTLTADKLDSPTETHTYFFGLDSTLPVVSIATDPAHLFDNRIGIYVAGTKGVKGRCSKKPVNWNQKWERPSSLEMYEPDGERVIHQDVGIEIFGNCSRLQERKSFELKARKLYGDGDIDYEVFEDVPLDEYDRLVLRNSGNTDAERTLFRDALQQAIIQGQMDLDQQAYRPAILFLNGQYWGIYNIRQKMDENFVERAYDLDEDEFDMLENKTRVINGSAAAWNNFYNFLRKQNLNLPANYAAVQAQLDVDSFMDYHIVEIYGANREWPGNNYRYWRAHDDGRWRWLLMDLDGGFLPGNYRENTVKRLTTASGSARDKYASLPFRRLLTNNEFRAEFVQRFAAHLNTTYDPARVLAIIDELQAGIAAEIPAHADRWGKPNPANWEGQVDILRQFAAERPAYMRQHLNEYLGSPGFANLTIQVEGQGEVLTAGVVVPGNGYSGPYFRDTPLRLEAVPQPGFRFLHWLETGETAAAITITLDGDMTRTAVFEPRSG